MRMLSGAPVWVWIILAVLVVIGIRRLRTREVPAAVALIPAAAFLIWSVVGAVAFARWAGPGPAAIAWMGGAALGVASMALAPGATAVRLPDGRVRQPGSVAPLIQYVLVFCARFACAAWAAMRPEHAVLATGLGIGVSAALTGRLVAGVARWMRAGTVAATA